MSIFIFKKSWGKANGKWKVGESCSASERQRVEETEFAEKKKKYEQHQQVSLTYFNVFKIR